MKFIAEMVESFELFAEVKKTVVKIGQLQALSDCFRVKDLTKVQLSISDQTDFAVLVVQLLQDRFELKKKKIPSNTRHLY